MDITLRTTAPTQMKVVHASYANKVFVAGRRAEINYRELGVSEATGGDMRAQVMHAEKSCKPTGWHYHTADVQFLFAVKGWVRMEFPDLGVVTLSEGDSIMIPGGVVHQELCSSEHLELLEISLPAKLGTVNVPAPTWGTEKAHEYGEISVPQE